MNYKDNVIPLFPKRNWDFPVLKKAISVEEMKQRLFDDATHDLSWDARIERHWLSELATDAEVQTLYQMTYGDEE